MANNSLIFLDGSKAWYSIEIPYSWPYEDAFVTITLLLETAQQTMGQAVWKWALDDGPTIDLILDPSDWSIGTPEPLPIWGCTIERDRPRLLTIWRELDVRDTIVPEDHPYLLGMVLSLEEI